MNSGNFISLKRVSISPETISARISWLPFEITNFTKLQFGESNDEVLSNIQVSAKEMAAEQQAAKNYTPVYAVPEPPPLVRSVELNEHSLKGASIDAEYELIVEALRKANFNKSKAAKILNVDRKTLYNKMKQYKQFNSDL